MMTYVNREEEGRGRGRRRERERGGERGGEREVGREGRGEREVGRRYEHQLMQYAGKRRKKRRETKALLESDRVGCEWH